MIRESLLFYRFGVLGEVEREGADALGGCFCFLCLGSGTSLIGSPTDALPTIYAAISSAKAGTGELDGYYVYRALPTSLLLSLLALLANFSSRVLNSHFLAISLLLLYQNWHLRETACSDADGITVSLTFGGQAYSIEATDFSHPADNEGVQCYGCTSCSLTSCFFLFSSSPFSPTLLVAFEFELEFGFRVRARARISSPSESES